jgi:CBS domain-containing protein
MERAEIRNVLVVEDEQLRGILTDRDIALRGVARGLNPRGIGRRPAAIGGRV